MGINSKVSKIRMIYKLDDDGLLTQVDRHPSPDHAVDLPNLYKRSIVFFRTLHSLVHLLPSYDLYRELYKHHDSSNALSIGYRLSSAVVQNNTEIPIGKENK